MLVSAWFWAGPEARVVEEVEEGRVVGYTSLRLLRELRTVLQDAKFRLTAAEVQTALGYYTTILRLVEPRQRVAAVREDPADDRVLECAGAARANYVVTGDRHLQKLGAFAGAEIRSATELLRLLKSRGRQRTE